MSDVYVSFTLKLENSSLQHQYLVCLYFSLKLTGAFDFPTETILIGQKLNQYLSTHNFIILKRFDLTRVSASFTVCL